MGTAITNTRSRYSTKEQAYNPRYVGWMCVLFFTLILGRSMNTLFFYIFAVVSLVVFALSSTKHCIPFLLFLLPFSTILKSNVNAISFFTILFFVVAAKMLFRNLKMDVRLLLCAMILFIYNFLFSGMGQLTTIVTMISGIFMLYYFRNEQVDLNSLVTTFSIGICLSSVLALCKTSLPIINTFVSDTMLKLGENNYSVRFSGLQGNPNYYTLDIIMALSAIIVLMYNTRKSNIIHIFCLVALSVLGLMSVSKSFLIAWALLIAFWFITSIKQGAGKLMKFLFIAVMGAAIAYYIAYDSINVYLLRFTQDSSGSISSITTGRSEIWSKYLVAIFDNIKILFLGNGLNTILESVGKGTHNTFIEALFTLGIVGTIILLTSIKIAMGKVSLKQAVWIPIVILGVRMFAIGILTYDNLWFYLMIIVALSINKETNQQIIRSKP